MASNTKRAALEEALQEFRDELPMCGNISVSEIKRRLDVTFPKTGTPQEKP